MKESEKRHWKKFANGRKPRIYKTMADYAKHHASTGMDKPDKSRLPKIPEITKLILLLIMIEKKCYSTLMFCTKCNLILIGEKTAELHDRVLGHKSMEFLDE